MSINLQQVLAAQRVQERKVHLIALLRHSWHGDVQALTEAIPDETVKAAGREIAQDLNPFRDLLQTRTAPGENEETQRRLQELTRNMKDALLHRIMKLAERKAAELAVLAASGTPGTAGTLPVTAQVISGIPQDILNSPISILNLSGRAEGALWHGNVTTIREILSRGEDGLFEIRGFGFGSLLELREKLGERLTLPESYFSKYFKSELKSYIKARILNK